MRSLLYLALIAGIFTSSNLSAQNYSIKASVQIWVDTTESPARIILNWLKDPDATNYFVHKKLKTATIWGNPIATISRDSTRYVDNNVVVGNAYEYRVSKTSALGNGFGYVYAAMKFPAVEWKGSILLIIDSMINSRLKMEIDVLKSDLANEAWNVLSHVPSATHSVKDIRTKISDLKRTNPDLRTVFIIGHVKVPYSGEMNPDSHGEHLGAWPSDTYYADIDGNWTDVLVDNATAARPENRNVPGDGKFDQTSIPSDVDLEVGRVDFYNMPAFTKSEVELLRTYLNKNHLWRTGQINAIRRGIVLDNFNFQGEAFGQTGIKNFSVLCHPNNVEYGNYRDSLRKKSYLFSYGSGPGSYTGAGGISTTANMATDSLQTVFTFLFGSYFGDWDSPNNFLRAALGSGTILTNAWSGRPHWFIHHMAMGDHIGYCTRLSMNNNSTYSSGNYPRYTHMALMGDPSLTMFPVAAVPSIKLKELGSHVEIRWQASMDATHGYYIYRKVIGNTIADVIARNVKDTVFVDSCVYNGLAYEYMVRAVKLESNASGSFYNLSAGRRDTITKINYPLPVADFSYMSDYEFLHLKSEARNARRVQFIIGKDTIVSSEANIVLDCNVNPQQVCLIAEGDCEKDMTCKTIAFDCSIPEISKLKIDSIRCYGEKGTIEIQDLKGADPFLFNWNTGGTSHQLKDVGAGMYAVTISSAKNTERVYTFNLTEPSELKATFTVRPADPGKNNGGILNLNIQGGTAPFQFAIAGQSLDSLSAGDYDLKITDAHGCELTIKVNIPVNTATEDYQTQATLGLYPSPAHDYLFLKKNDAVSIQKLMLFDAQGKLLQQIRLSEDKIDISALVPGWYAIQCITNSGIEYYSFEKQ